MTTERERFEAWAKTQAWPHYWHNGGGMVFNESSFEAWQAALSAPPGYVMVPVEPTPEMLVASVRSREGPAVYNVTSEKGLAVLESDAADDYRAMISAAQKEPT